MEQNYRLTIAYDGSRFFGWERQPDKDTIQGKLEAVLGALQGHPVNVIGAGRTDAGVHARAMTASVVLDVTETPDAIRDYLNRYLPDAIAVREVKEAAPRFHARYNALGKTYRYTCHTGPVKPVFDRKYVTLLDYDPDVEKMRQAAAYLLGENDFASFCGNPRMKKSTVRLVDHIAIERRKDRVLNEALDAARRVEAEHGPVTLSPMGSSERRIVHQALRDNPKVKTYSQPEDAQGMKCVVVCPADMEIPEVPARGSKIDENQQPTEG